MPVCAFPLTIPMPVVFLRLFPCLSFSLDYSHACLCFSLDYSHACLCFSLDYSHACLCFSLDYSHACLSFTSKNSHAWCEDGRVETFGRILWLAYVEWCRVEGRPRLCFSFFFISFLSISPFVATCNAPRLQLHVATTSMN